MIIDFKADVTSGICSLDVKFEIISDDDEIFDNCEENIKYLILDYGDGSYSTSLKFNQNHIYTSIGLYTVSLYVSDKYISFDIDENNFIIVLNDSTSVIKTNYIEVLPLFPNLYVNHDILFSGNLAIFTIDITDEDFKNVSYLLLDYGDGTYSTQLVKTHYKQYSTEAEYIATLYVSNTKIFFKVENNKITLLNENCVFKSQIEIIVVDIDLDFEIDIPYCISPLYTTLSLKISDIDFNKIRYMKVDFGDGNISYLKQKKYYNEYLVSKEDGCNSFDVTVYASMDKIIDLDYSKIITKKSYVKVINDEIDFTFLSDVFLGPPPLQVNFKIDMNFMVLINCIKFILIDFDDETYEYCEDCRDKLNYFHEFKTEGIFKVKSYLSFDPIQFTTGPMIVESECIIEKELIIITENIDLECSVEPSEAINPVTSIINIGIPENFKDYMKYLLIDFGDGQFIYTDKIESEYTHNYTEPGQYSISSYVSDKKITYEIKDMSDLQFKIPSYPEAIPECRNVLVVNDCDGRIRHCFSDLNVKHTFFSYSADLCPCEGFIPFTVLFTIIISMELFDRVNYILFDFGDGTHYEYPKDNNEKTLSILKEYTTVGIFSPILYLCSSPIDFTIEDSIISVNNLKYVSNYMRQDYVVAMNFDFLFTPDNQKINVDENATFDVEMLGVPEPKYQAKCSTDLPKGDPWGKYNPYTIIDFGDGYHDIKFLNEYIHTYVLGGTFTVIIYLSLQPIKFSVIGKKVVVVSPTDPKIIIKKSVTVDVFKPIDTTVNLTVERIGDGSIIDNDINIDCSTISVKCSSKVEHYSDVNLVATPSSGYTFLNWSNCPNPVNNICNFKIYNDIKIIGNFSPLTKSKFAWMITSSLNTSSSASGACGTTSSTLLFGGWMNPMATMLPESEKWTGAAWSITTALNNLRAFLSGCGTVIDALAFGGSTTTELDDLLNITEKLTNSIWATTSSLNISRYLLAGCGSTSKALAFGGAADSGINYNLNSTEIWNGSVWSTTNNLTSGRNRITGCGSTSKALACSGNNGSAMTLTELWNGMSWYTTSNLNVARYSMNCSGDPTNAISYGGIDSSILNENSGILDITELWDGIVWSITSSLNVARRHVTGCGDGYAALSFGGFNGLAVNSTERWNSTSDSRYYCWVVKSSLNILRSTLAGCGISTFALSFGGNNLPTWLGLNSVEKYENSVWSVTSSLNNSSYALEGCGTMYAALSFGGSNGSPINSTEKWNGTIWSITSSLNTARQSLSGCGSSSNALSFGGNSGTIINNCEKWNSSTWQVTTSLNYSRHRTSGCGGINDAICVGGYFTSNLSAVEKWNGATWSITTSSNIFVSQHKCCGDANTAILFGGNTGSYSAVTEILKSNVWTITSSLNTARQSLSGCGNPTSALSFGGFTGDFVNVSEMWIYD